MITAKAERSETARLVAEGAEKFRKAVERERERRAAPRDESLRVLSETIGEERRAIEQSGGAIELRGRAVAESLGAESNGDTKKKRLAGCLPPASTSASSCLKPSHG